MTDNLNALSDFLRTYLAFLRQQPTTATIARSLVESLQTFFQEITSSGFNTQLHPLYTVYSSLASDKLPPLLSSESGLNWSVTIYFLLLMLILQPAPISIAIAPTIPVNKHSFDFLSALHVHKTESQLLFDSAVNYTIPRDFPFSQSLSPLLFNPALYLLVTASLPHNNTIVKLTSLSTFRNPPFSDARWSKMIGSIHSAFHVLDEKRHSSQVLQDSVTKFENIFAITHYLATWIQRQYPTPWVLADQTPFPSFPVKIMVNNKRQISVEIGQNETWQSLRIRIAKIEAPGEWEKVSLMFNDQNMTASLLMIRESIFAQNATFSKHVFIQSFSLVSALVGITFTQDDPLKTPFNHYRAYFRIPQNLHPILSIFPDDTSGDCLMSCLEIGARISPICHIICTLIAEQFADLTTPESDDNDSSFWNVSQENPIYDRLPTNLDTPLAVFSAKKLVTTLNQIRHVANQRNTPVSATAENTMSSFINSALSQGAASRLVHLFISFQFDPNYTRYSQSCSSILVDVFDLLFFSGSIPNHVDTLISALSFTWEDCPSSTLTPSNQKILFFVALSLYHLNISASQATKSLLTGLSPLSQAEMSERRFPFQPIDSLPTQPFNSTSFLASITSFLTSLTTSPDPHSVIRFSNFSSTIQQFSSQQPQTAFIQAFRLLCGLLPDHRSTLFNTPSIQLLLISLFLNCVETESMNSITSLQKAFPTPFIIHAVFFLILNSVDQIPFISTGALSALTSILVSAGNSLSVSASSLIPHFSSLFIHRRELRWANGKFAFSFSSLLRILKQLILKWGITRTKDTTELIGFISDALLFSVPHSFGPIRITRHDGNRKDLMAILDSVSESNLTDILVSSLSHVTLLELDRSPDPFLIRSTPLPSLPATEDEVDIVRSNVGVDGFPTWSYRGISNPGSVCYAISQLQILFMNPQLRTILFGVDMRLLKPVSEASSETFVVPKSKPSKNIAVFSRCTSQHQKTDPLTQTTQLYMKEVVEIWTELRKLMCHLQETNKSEMADLLDKYDDIRPLAAVIRDDNGNSLDLHQQEDSSNFLSSLLYKLSGCFEQFNLPNPIQHLFFIDTVEINECPSRHYSEMSATRAPLITCTVFGRTTLEDSLSADLLEKVTSSNCATCQIDCEQMKHRLFRNLPSIVAFNLQRYRFDEASGTVLKMNDLFKFPITEPLDLFPYTEESFILHSQISEASRLGISDHACSSLDRARGYYLYRLTGVVVHEGSARAGHYYCFVKERDCTVAEEGEERKGRWIKFDDGATSVVDVQTIEDDSFGGTEVDPSLIEVAKVANFGRENGILKRKSAFILVYERITPEPEWRESDVTSFQTHRPSVFNTISSIFTPPISPAYHFSRQSQLIPRPLLVECNLEPFSSAGKSWTGFDLIRKSVLYVDEPFDLAKSPSTFVSLAYKLFLTRSSAKKTEKQAMLLPNTPAVPFPFLVRREAERFNLKTTDFMLDGFLEEQTIILWIDTLVTIYSRSPTIPQHNFFVSHCLALEQVIHRHPSVSFLFIENIAKRCIRPKKTSTQSQSLVSLFFRSCRNEQIRTSFSRLIGVAFVSTVKEIAGFLSNISIPSSQPQPPLQFTVHHDHITEILTKLAQSVVAITLDVLSDQSSDPQAFLALLHVLQHIAATRPLASTVLIASGIPHFLVNSIYPPAGSVSQSIVVNPFADRIRSMFEAVKNDIFTLIYAVFQKTITPTAQGAREILGINTTYLFESFEGLPNTITTPPILLPSYALYIDLMSSPFDHLVPSLFTFLYFPIRIGLAVKDTLSSPNPSNAMLLLASISETVFSSSSTSDSSPSFTQQSLSLFIQLWSALSPDTDQPPHPTISDLMLTFFQQLRKMSSGNAARIVDAVSIAPVEPRFFNLLRTEPIQNEIISLLSSSGSHQSTHFLSILLRLLQIKSNKQETRMSSSAFSDSVSIFTPSRVYSSIIVSSSDRDQPLVSGKTVNLPSIPFSVQDSSGLTRNTLSIPINNTPHAFTFSSSYSFLDKRCISIFEGDTPQPQNGPKTIQDELVSNPTRQLSSFLKQLQPSQVGVENMSALLSVLAWMWTDHESDGVLAHRPTRFQESAISSEWNQQDLASFVEKIFVHVNLTLSSDSPAYRIQPLVVLVSFIAAFTQTSTLNATITAQILESLLTSCQLENLPSLFRWTRLPPSQSPLVTSTQCEQIEFLFLTVLLLCIIVRPSLVDVLTRTRLLDPIFSNQIDQNCAKSAQTDSQTLAVCFTLVCAAYTSEAKARLLKLSKTPSELRSNDLISLYSNPLSLSSVQDFVTAAESFRTHHQHTQIRLPALSDILYHPPLTFVMPPPPPPSRHRLTPPPPSPSPTLTPSLEPRTVSPPRSLVFQPPPSQTSFMPPPFRHEKPH
ncbi:putative Ubiquitin carboxyl-terminal hydrolase 34 [Blattamonas nauphoetae]|uniref:Ubiquitin carboxyl-terminal hydrolase 34 n=1 Tax=Blattamonas nauphoetae TaxID=2049346 RepID=A0ABQ9YAP9_9EUKA|nr:putative Ubiquitin carboxyl-terminal hydrolase 34 [Blattamonas nauphoetae]